MEKRLRGPVPGVSKQQYASVNLGLLGPLFDKATQGSQSESCLDSWRHKGPREEIDRRCPGGTVPPKTPRPSERFRAKVRMEMGSGRSCSQG